MTNPRTDSPRQKRWSEWLCRAAVDDRLAFAQLATELQTYLLARLRIAACTRELFRIPQDVEDALHDTLVAVWEKRATFNPQGNAVAWLWIICRNGAVNILRRRSRQRAASLHDREGRLIADRAIDPAHSAELASDSEERRQMRHTVARALRAVEPRVRRAWRLRFRKGQPYAAIARRLGVPQGTIATWLHRFKQGLRQAAIPPKAGRRRAARDLQ
jgi:RNA polymerase sigma-70 factor (ECF subfamily)